MFEKVSVVLSLYKPDEVYLKKQLDSINFQDYEGVIEVIVYNDDPTDNDRESFIKACLSNHHVKYLLGDENLGYVKAFEKLVTMADGRYIAFCDQDDLWRKDRLRKGVEALEEGSVLAVCDRSIIDEADTVIVDSWRKSHPRSAECSWNTGDTFTDRAAFTCYAIGMATMMRTDCARSCIPFPTCTGHDKWLALCASEMGKCAFIEEPLVSYRRHGNNVTGAFSGIETKDDWYRKRTLDSLELAQIFAEKFPSSPTKEKILGFAKARDDRNIIQIARYCSLAPAIAWFEIGIKYLPESIFEKLMSRFR